MTPHETTQEQQQVINQMLRLKHEATTQGKTPVSGFIGAKQMRAFNLAPWQEVQIAGVTLIANPDMVDNVWIHAEHQPPKTAQDVVTEWNATATGPPQALIPIKLTEAQKKRLFAHAQKGPMPPTFESIHDGHRSSHFFRSWMEAPEPNTVLEARNKLRTLAEQYHQTCEEYDRTICTGPIIDGAIMPADHQQYKDISRHAQDVRNKLAPQALALGFTRTQWDDAITSAGVRFKLREKHANPTKHTTEAVGWKGKLTHDRSKHADWGWIRDEAGELVIIVKMPFMEEEELHEHRRNGTDPAQARVDLILTAINGAG